MARGVVQTTVSGSGNLEPAEQDDLTFGAGGTVTNIYAHEGQQVIAGQLLATLDDSSARVNLAKAKASLQSAQDTLDDVHSGNSNASDTSGGDQASATTAVASAAGKPPTTTTPTAPTSSTPTRTVTVTTPAPSSSVSGSGGGGSGSGMSEEAAKADLESARLDVENAGKELEATRLRAPIGGTIAEINGAVGDTVSAGSSSNSSSSNSTSSGSSGPSIAGGLGGGGGGSSSSDSSSGSGSGFITLADVDSFKMDVSLSESDIWSVKKGQSASVTVNAASGEKYAAHVSLVGVLPSSSSSSSSSAVSYPVTLTLDQGGVKLKPGMSATADIVTAQASGITIPTQALNGNTVTVVRDGKRTTQQVQAGVAGESTTLITSGLQVGDQVVVRSQSASASPGGASIGNGAGGLRGGLGARGTGGGGFPGGGPPTLIGPGGGGP